ncbi:MAG: hypothetical protein WBM41_20185 [Arenicellales bacterium]
MSSANLWSTFFERGFAKGQSGWIDVVAIVANAQFLQMIAIEGAVMEVTVIDRRFSIRNSLGKITLLDV